MILPPYCSIELKSHEDMTDFSEEGCHKLCNEELRELHLNRWFGFCIA